MDMTEISRLSPAAQKQIIVKLGTQPKANKFHNEPAVRCLQGGKPIKFQSQREARRFDQLMLKLRAGVIRNLKLQEVFVLQAAYTTPEGAAFRELHTGPTLPMNVLWRRTRPVRRSAGFPWSRMPRASGPTFIP